jgi:hypothetical protein
MAAGETRKRFKEVTKFSMHSCLTIVRKFRSLFPDLDSYATCNIDKRPLYALVTSKNTTNEMVTKMQNVLNGATLADLVKGGMVSSGIEKLEPFTGSAEAYVGDYGKHYKALNGPNTPAPGPNSAPTGLVSCILQAIAIFAFLMLV